MNLIDTIWRKSLICFAFAVVRGFLISVSAQWPDEEKDVQFENISVAQMLDSLSVQFKVNFSYNAGLDIFQEKKSISKKAKLETILNYIFKNSDIEVSIIDKQVIIYALFKPEKGEPIHEEKSLYRTIKGQLLDSEKTEVLSYASISISGTSISTISNNEGRFSLKIPAENFKDSIYISFLGYESFVVPVHAVPEGEWEVKLREVAIQIEPVHIKPVGAESIVRQMLERIPHNYRRRNAMYTAFYREITSDETSSLSLSEALLDIAKAPYGSAFLNDQARVFRGRKEEDITRIRKMAFKLEGGIYNSLRLDVIKEEAAFLTTDGMRNYDYNYRRVISYEGRNLHVIDFQGKRNVDDIVYQGTLYIDVVSKALVAVKFEMSPQGLKNARSYLVRKQPRKSNIKPVSANYVTLYKYYNGKYYLHYTRAELSVKAKSDRLFINEKFTAVAELAVTSVDTTNTMRFRWSDISKSGDILNEHLRSYDESYWGNYNIISPGVQINEAMESFRQLKNKDQE